MKQSLIALLLIATLLTGCLLSQDSIQQKQEKEDTTKKQTEHIQEPTPQATSTTQLQKKEESAQDISFEECAKYDWRVFGENPKYCIIPMRVENYVPGEYAPEKNGVEQIIPEYTQKQKSSGNEINYSLLPRRNTHRDFYSVWVYAGDDPLDENIEIYVLVDAGGESWVTNKKRIRSMNLWENGKLDFTDCYRKKGCNAENMHYAKGGGEGYVGTWEAKDGTLRLTLEKYKVSKRKETSKWGRRVYETISSAFVDPIIYNYNIVDLQKDMLKLQKKEDK